MGNKVQEDDLVGHDSHAPTPLVEVPTELGYDLESTLPSEHGHPTQ